MRHLLSVAAALALAAGTLTTAPASPRQTTPRGEMKQAKADRKMERAHTVRHGESLSKEPKLVREEDKLARKNARKHKH